MNTDLEGNSVHSSRLSQWGVIGFTLAVFGVAILLVTLQLRKNIEDQILRRDGEVLNAIALMQEYADDNLSDLGSLDQDPLDHIAMVLETSRMRNALAVRLLDAQGGFVTGIPANTKEVQLNTNDLAPLRVQSPLTRFYSRARLSDYLLPPAMNTPAEPTMSILEVLVALPPNRPQQLVGVAQFILDGSHVREELATANRYLFGYTAAVFFLGGLVIVLALSWSFRQLAHSHRLLSQRTRDLLQANHELTMAAKTSALGAVTAHLLHGLKNPLSGLQSFVASGSGEAGALGQEDWRDAVATTRRMQTLINDIVRILREEDGVGQYQIQLDELMAMIGARVRPVAGEAGVRWDTIVRGQGVLSNRDANLVMLILENLIQNAVQATPAGKSVQLTVTDAENGMVFEIADEGSGLPENVRASLFSPCRSTKPGGSGIGLALSKQLATQLGAELSLQKSTPQGSVFRLTMPVQRTHETVATA